MYMLHVCICVYLCMYNYLTVKLIGLSSIPHVVGPSPLPISRSCKFSITQNRNSIPTKQ